MTAQTWNPYADGTSGHSGDSSEKAEPVRRDRIEQAYRFVALNGMRGVTWREYAQMYGLHHGIASSALSNLHRSGMIARLKEKRNGCGIYVTASSVGTRPTVPHRTNKRSAQKERILARLGELDPGLGFGLMEEVITIIKEEL